MSIEDQAHLLEPSCHSPIRVPWSSLMKVQRHRRSRDGDPCIGGQKCLVYTDAERFLESGSGSLVPGSLSVQAEGEGERELWKAMPSWGDPADHKQGSRSVRPYNINARVPGDSGHHRLGMLSAPPVLVRGGTNPMDGYLIRTQLCQVGQEARCNCPAGVLAQKKRADCRAGGRIAWA